MQGYKMFRKIYQQANQRLKEGKQNLKDMEGRAMQSERLARHIKRELKKEEMAKREIEIEQFQEENFTPDNEITYKKYPWLMTQTEYQQIKAIEKVGSPRVLDMRDGDVHEQLVKRALLLGLDVPKEVLRNYPWLKEVEDIYPKSNENVLAVSPAGTLLLLIGDQWFTQNPSKILGTPYETTDRFGKKVIKVKGTMENIIQGIDVPLLDMPVDQKEKSVLESDVKESISSLLSDKVHLDNVESIVKEAKQRIAKKELSRVMNEALPEEKQMLGFDEIMTKYNPGISAEEIKAWLWHKRKSGGMNDATLILKKSSGWNKYVIPLSESEKHIKKWLSEGIVCFYKGDYLPASLYYAENIYERIRALKADAKEVEAEQFQRQLKGLENILPPKLTLTDPQKENRLSIKPISSFAQGIVIEKLADGTVFTGPSTNLKEAYKYWLRLVDKAKFKKSTNWDIINYYLDDRTPSNSFDKEEKLRLKQNAKKEGDEFFVEFLAEGLTRDSQVAIEEMWNEKYNGYVDINYFKIPVAFSCSATFKNKPLFIRQAQREGIGFISVHGTGCIAYDVGVGKTMTAILSLAQALEFGQCRRPFIVVPNQTYQNWLNEIRGKVEGDKVILSGILPQYQVIDLYNLGAEYIDQLRDDSGKIQPVPEYSISVMTYEGFNRLAFNEATWKSIGNELYEILNQGTEEKREQAKLMQRIEELMGRGMQGGMVEVEDLGFDYMVVDEAHAMKKSFTKVKGEQKTGGGFGRSRYNIQGGEPSMIALRGFMMSQYILRNNNMRNVQLLTATPFTNSPLEIYSMLALIGYQQIKEMGVRNIKEFFDVFIRTSLELVINARLKPERREIVMGFSNLIALQSMIFRFITYKSGEDAGIQRPNKIVLPLLSEKIGNEMVLLPEEKQVSTNLMMTSRQREFMRDVEMYVTGKTSLVHFCVNTSGEEERGETSEISGELLDEKKLSKEEEDSARVLRGLSFARQLALSPYLYGCNPDKHPTFEQYIETSPKLLYVMQCIKSVKKFHEERDEEVSGQVIYMNSGVSFFPMIKEYLVKKIGFREAEIGIISSGISAPKKEAIKEKFLSGEIKIVIGSASIKEGINLQERTSTLYDCWVDWNPTDIKQLEGRIWRYGNRYGNVRIVIPLMENSIDTFIFQKLLEKTSRINEIWYRSGKVNALNLEEFNPAELKMGLVTDPYALAELMLLEEKEQVYDEIKGLQSQIEIIEQISQAREVFNAGIPEIRAEAAKYRPQKQTAGKAEPRSVDTLLNIYGDYLDDENSSGTMRENMLYSNVRRAYSTLKRGLEQVLKPRGYDITFDRTTIVDKIKMDIEERQEYLKQHAGEEAVREKAEEIAREREERGYRSKSVEERVKEFSRLNQKVLTEMMIYPGEKEIVTAHIKKGKALEGVSAKLDKIKKLQEAFAKMKQGLERLRALKIEKKEKVNERAAIS